MAVAVAVKDAIYRGRVRTTEEAIDAWRFYSEAGQALEPILRESILALDALSDVERDCWALLRMGKMTRMLEIGRLLGTAIQMGSRMVQRALECINHVEDCGYTPESAAIFRRRVLMFQKIQKKFTRWPFPKREEMEKAIAEIERGEVIDIGSWIASLQNEAHSEVCSGNN